MRTSRIKMGATSLWALLLCLMAGVSLNVSFAETGDLKKTAGNTTPPIARTTTNKDAPSIFSPSARYEFSPVHDGALVQHDFSIHNRGNQDLEIKRVITA